MVGNQYPGIAFQKYSPRNTLLDIATQLNNMIIGSIVIRCFEFEKMFHFWKEALHYLITESVENDWIILRDPKGRKPNISLDKINTPWTGKRGRIHLDLYTEDQTAEVERLVSLGARQYPWRYEEDHDYVVLEDPDGNLFCVVQI